MSRKPIFSQEAKQQVPYQQQTNFQKSGDTRSSQYMAQSQAQSPSNQDKYQTYNSAFTSHSAFTSNAPFNTNPMDAMNVSQMSTRSVTVDDNTLQRMIADAIERESQGPRSTRASEELMRKDINTLAQHMREYQKQMEMLRAVYFDQKNQQPPAQQVAPNVQEKLFASLQSFEESLASKLSNTQEQLMQHQEIFQSNHAQKLLELKSALEQMRGQVNVNDSKLNKCIQYISKIDIQQDQVAQANQKYDHLESALTAQIKQLQNNYQSYVHSTTKKMSDVENQFTEMNIMLQKRPLTTHQDQGISGVSEQQLSSLTSELTSLKHKLSELQDLSTSQLITLTDQTKHDLTTHHDELQAHKRQHKELQLLVDRQARQADELKQTLQQDVRQCQTQIQAIAVSLQEDVGNLNSVLELRLKNMENLQYQTKKNDILFSFNQKLVDTEPGSSTRPASYAIQSEKLEVDSDNHDKVFKSVEVETFEYVDNKFVDDDSDSHSTEQRIPTESDVVEFGTLKGDNKESYLERLSEMARLPDISERFDEQSSNYESTELLPTRHASSHYQDQPHHNNLLTDSEMHQNEPLPTQEEEVTYQLDENGFLMDEDNQYILDDDGQMIQLNSEQIDYLKQQQMLQEDD